MLVIEHRGPRAAEVVEWRSTVLGLDAVLVVDRSATGAGLLRLVDKHGSLPLSPELRGTKVRHGDDGQEWKNLAIPEVAVVPAGELSWARLRRWEG